ncbi:MAG: NADPH-dependent F420 reductase [Methanothrix sp.]|nr:NADPH-dependent F420 reductase [Methanothrix sp.]
MKIGIIGSGNVGSALGKIWGKNGHEIRFSSRNPEKLRALAESIGKNASYGLPVEAAKFGEVIVLAVPWGQAENAIKSAGSLEGKILIDCTNPLKADYSGLAVGGTTSAAEEVARLAPGAKVIKAFHTTFAALMQSESRMFGSINPTGFYCGDDAAAKAVVANLIQETGLEPMDVGPLANARYLEPLAMLMINLGFAQKMGTNIAIKLLRR